MVTRNPQTPTRPLVVLVIALLCQFSAGVVYWWPAITPGISHYLGFSPAQSLVLIATANAGSGLGILGGLFHYRFGSRITTSVGAASMTVCFLAMAFFTLHPPSNFAFAIMLLLTVAIDTTSYMVYSACLTAAVAVFPRRFRGRVSGLSAACYGASAGIFGSIQAAFFPTIAHTSRLLFFVACYCAFVIMISFGLPAAERFEVDSIHHNSDAYDSVPSSYPVESPEFSPTPEVSLTHGASATETESRIAAAYSVAWILVSTLQLSSVAEILEVSHLLLTIAASAVIFSMAVFLFIPVRSKLIIYSKPFQDDQPLADAEISEPPLRHVVADPRYLFLCLSFLVTIGGGGTALLVQSRSLAVSHLHATSPNPTADDIAMLIRTFVVIFSACNLTGRLAMGTIADWGRTSEESQMWKYTLLQCVSFVICQALIAVAFSRSWELFTAVALIGLCHGSFFSLVPALTTIWFGVHSFPRNFSLLGPFTAVGSATLASTIPSFLSHRYGQWIEVGGKDSCVSKMCKIAPFGLLAGLHALVHLLGWVLRGRVKRGAQSTDF